MKNFVYTSLFLLIFSTAATAQLQQGRLFLSGRISVQAVNQDGGLILSTTPFLNTTQNVTATSVEVAPSLGFLFAGNLAGGLELGYSFSSTTLEQPPTSSFFPRTQESRLWIFSVRPFMRYYRGLGEKAGFQLDIYGGIGFGKSIADRLAITTVEEVTEDISSFELGLSPGLYYFLSPRFMIDASIGGIGYESNKATPDVPGAVSRRSSRFSTFLDSGLGLRLGVNFFFHPGGR